MVETVLDFVRANPQVSAAKNAEPQTMVGAVAQGNALGTLATLNAAGHLQSYFLYTLAWLDDGYSTDLAETYRKVFSDHAKAGSNRAVTNFYNDFVLYSPGDYYQPNPREEMAVGLYLANNDRFHDQHQLLVLPTAAQARGGSCEMPRRRARVRPAQCRRPHGRRHLLQQCLPRP